MSRQRAVGSRQSETPSFLPTAYRLLPTDYCLLPMPLIELRNVSKRFGRLIVLRDLTLKIDEGQSIVIIGASGSGKSVMLKHIVGLLRPDSGEVFFDGERIDNLPEKRLSELRTNFGFLFQMGALFDSLT